MLRILQGIHEKSWPRHRADKEELQGPLAQKFRCEADQEIDGQAVGGILDNVQGKVHESQNRARDCGWRFVGPKYRRTRHPNDTEDFPFRWSRVHEHHPGCSQDQRNHQRLPENQYAHHNGLFGKAKNKELKENFNFQIFLNFPSLKKSYFCAAKINRKFFQLEDENPEYATLVKARLEKTILEEVLIYIKEVRDFQNGCYLMLKINLEKIEKMKVHVTIDTIVD